MSDLLSEFYRLDQPAAAAPTIPIRVGRHRRPPKPRRIPARHTVLEEPIPGPTFLDEVVLLACGAIFGVAFGVIGTLIWWCGA